MFEGLQERLDATFRRLRGEGKVSEEVLHASLKEIRLALLEGDVHFKVVKAFIHRVEERALGERVLDSLTAAHCRYRTIGTLGTAAALHHDLIDAVAAYATQQQEPRIAVAGDNDDAGRTFAATIINRLSQAGFTATQIAIPHKYADLNHWYRNEGALAVTRANQQPHTTDATFSL